MQKLLILIEKVNKNYRLPLKRLYGCTVLNNLDYRKESSENGLIAKQVNSRNHLQQLQITKVSITLPISGRNRQAQHCFRLSVAWAS
jgi:hypothetical protein